MIPTIRFMRRTVSCRRESVCVLEGEISGRGKYPGGEEVAGEWGNDGSS